MLRAPHGAATRPTSEKVRQALFNILGPPAPDTHVLDLFAGSGALTAVRGSNALAATIGTL